MISKEFSMQSSPKVNFGLAIWPKGANTYMGHCVFVNLFLSLSEKDSELAFYRLTIVNSKDVNYSIVQEGKLMRHETLGSMYFSQINIVASYLLNPDNGFLPDDKLTVDCEVIYGPNLFNRLSKLIKNGNSDTNNNKNSTRKSAFTSPTSGNSLLEKFSDILVVLGGKEFRVHRNILASKSVFFAEKFKRQPNCFEIRDTDLVEDIDAETFEEVLRFMYSESISTNIDVVMKLLVVASKNLLKMDALRNTCLQKLYSSLSTESVVQILLFADKQQIVQLKQKCKEFITENAKEVKRTDAWKQQLKEQPDLLMELYEDIVENWTLKKLRKV